MGFHDEEAETGESDLRLQQGMRDALEAEGEATFEGLREEGGVRVAVIAFEIETEMELEYELEPTEGMPDNPIRVAGGERTFEGELLWDLEAEAQGLPPRVQWGHRVRLEPVRSTAT